MRGINALTADEDNLSDFDSLPFGVKIRMLYFWYKIKIMQKIVAEDELERKMSEGWNFKSQLQSGRIVVEKNFTIDELVKIGEQSLRQG